MQYKSIVGKRNLTAWRVVRPADVAAGKDGVEQLPASVVRHHLMLCACSTVRVPTFPAVYLGQKLHINYRHSYIYEYLAYS